jgi:hypothetical protein
MVEPLDLLALLATPVLLLLLRLHAVALPNMLASALAVQKSSWVADKHLLIVPHFAATAALNSF